MRRALSVERSLSDHDEALDMTASNLLFALTLTSALAAVMGKGDSAVQAAAATASKRETCAFKGSGELKVTARARPWDDAAGARENERLLPLSSP
jgi:hypothetical protein